VDSGSYGLTFAGGRLAVNWRGKAAQELLEFLFDGILGDASSPFTETFSLCFRTRSGESFRDGEEFTELSRADRRLYQGTNPGALADLLLDQSIHALADPCAEGLLLHAAAVAWREQGVLMPAVSGSGKTTNAAWFTASGFDYLTDELVFIENASQRLSAFCRPLHLKTPMIETFKAITGQKLDTESSKSQPLSVMRSRKGVFARPQLFNPDSAYCIPRLSVIVFPGYRTGARLELTRLSKAEAGMRLMQNVINARNLPRHGLDEVSRLVRQTPAYALTYGHVEETQGVVRSLLD
jgi:hypothetical protein